MERDEFLQEIGMEILYENGWRNLYKDSSIPFNPGDIFLIRKNRCKCGTQEPYTRSCGAQRDCIVKVKCQPGGKIWVQDGIRTDVHYEAIKRDGTKAGSFTGRSSIVLSYKEFKIIHLSLL